jgi:replicative DNA helicase
MERFEAAQQHHRLVTGVETGFHQLDELTSGFQPGELVIVAGRPSMGKTALALNIAVNAATRGKVPVAVFSLEMSDESLTGRILCSTAGVSMRKVRRGMITNREKSQLTAALGPLGEAPMFIDDTAGLNALEIRARARRKQSEANLGLIIIDYLQLMEAHGAGRRDRNRQQEISEISRALKAMAKELNVPVVALSQLSRQPEARPDKRPQLSDLRESGAIEQDADLVLLLFRAKLYAREGDEVDDTAEVNIAKQRNGPLGTVKLTFLDDCMRFENPYLHGQPEPAEEEAEGPGEEDDYLPA